MTKPALAYLRDHLRKLLRPAHEDEQANRRPGRDRAPVVLCHLQGKTHEAAARDLGWPVGTVRSALARGRDVLRRRLLRRQLTLTSAALAAVLAAERLPAVPAALT